MRRISELLHIDQKTVARKLEYLGETLKLRLTQVSFKGVRNIQFDELQTIEHTKCKPLSVVMAVSTEDRHILGFRVSKMPATGHLAEISRKKYGPRPDHRRKGLYQLFRELHSKIKHPFMMSKKTRHDPLFTINHTFAMLRANINRLVRKTWCTTKKIARLIDHLTIYAFVHNNFIFDHA